MWRYGRFAVPVLVLLGLIGLFARGLFLNPTVVPSPLIGKPAPVFSLPNLDPSRPGLSNADFAGKVVLLNVWGSWCVACRDEHPVLVQFAASRVLPIYGLDYKDDRKSAEDWLRSGGNPYTDIAYDPSGDVAINWGVYGAPETFLLDKHGVIRQKYIGPLTPDLIATDLLPLVQKLEREP